MTEPTITPFQRILVANRSEIAIRVFRACTELGMQTVAVYAEEDRLHLHRYKADEAYLIGRGKSPVAAYLGIDELVALAVAVEVDAIHPGYGFLSENPDFARACAVAGIAFIGPPAPVLETLGDKVRARQLAVAAGVPVIPGTAEAVATAAEAFAFAADVGYPLIVKAAMGGGGRGMTVVRDDGALADALTRSRSEAQAAFGNPKVFLERYLEAPRHIEVQLLADQHGGLVHLFERDCSIQRRHQKVVEIAPSRSLTDQQRAALYEDALAIGRAAGYQNAGTVEFLLDREGRHYFIEVNPRIQVEHTVTEAITGRDLVQCQIRVAEGYPLADPRIRIPAQEAVKRSGYCIQLRITTEDPANGFAPDQGRITAFRPGEGFGIRLDGGSGFDGAVISPHYDSLLVKVCAWALDFDQAAAKALRAIREFRIRGVKTNIPFLENLLQHPRFLSGDLDTSFIEHHAELLDFKPRRDRANKLLDYLSEVIVNGFPGIAPDAVPRNLPTPSLPTAPPGAAPQSPAFLAFRDGGARGLARWMLGQQRLLVTDTTLRDAHQSLLATRLRTRDMLRVAPASASLAAPLFSFEMWGGATFDVAYRFLHEDPWERLRLLRRMLPGALLQMLLRAGNAVGYANYPDNVVDHFIDQAARGGIDIFRIFDSLNSVEALIPCIARVAEAGKVAEGAVCYSGDLSDNRRTRFTLSYYLDKARRIEAAGAHILGIKDMAGLLKPEAARILVTELKNALTIPVHLHTHDTSGNGIATLLAASAAGVDAVDAALSAMSGLTSQPSLNALVAALAGTPRDPGFDLDELQRLADYWEGVRRCYAPFESGLLSGSADVYHHEIPGGQYSNLRQQAIALDLGNRWDEVRRMYRVVNDMLGDIVKVTPSSKAVGDMALFMVQNDLGPEAVLARGQELAYPQSFVDLLSGQMGQPDSGFPPALQKAVLGDRQPLRVRPGTLLPPHDFAADRAALRKRWGREADEETLSSLALYPEVMQEYLAFHERFGDVSVLDSRMFFYGLKIGDEVAIIIEAGKTLIVKLLAIGDLRQDGTRELFYELNGRRRSLVIADRASGVSQAGNEKADPGDPQQIAAPMAGKIVALHIAEGEEVTEGQPLVTTEAMKMMNVIQAPQAGQVFRLPLPAGSQVAAGDLVCALR